MIYYHLTQFYETDRMGIIHHSNYIRWMEEARMALLENIGWGYKKIEESGIYSPVVEINCRYKKQITYGEKIEIQVFLKKISVVKGVFGYIMRNEKGEICTEGHSTHCFIRNNGSFVNVKEEMPDFYKKLLTTKE